MRREFRSGLASATRVIMARLRPARTGTMTIIHIPARPTDTTVRIGSTVAPSSVPGRGSVAIMAAAIFTADEASTAAAAVASTEVNA